MEVITMDDTDVKKVTFSAPSYIWNRFEDLKKRKKMKGSHLFQMMTNDTWSQEKSASVDSPGA